MNARRIRSAVRRAIRATIAAVAIYSATAAPASARPDEPAPVRFAFLYSLELLVSAPRDGAPAIVSSAILDHGMTADDCRAELNRAPAVLWSGSGGVFAFLACRPE